MRSLPRPEDEPRPVRPVVLPDELSQIARLALRLDEVAAALGVSRRAIERERSAGRFPPADCRIGKCPLWMPETIRTWLQRGAR
jgi:predicted DNA-binding transcriptional regulator AlpA